MPVYLYMKPIDTLFFRDSRPFTAREDIYGECIFPSPLAIYGAIGSYYIETHGYDLEGFLRKEITIPKLGRYSTILKETGFTIKGPFLAFDKKPFFPAPSNLWVSGYSKHTPHILSPNGTNGKSDLDIGISPIAPPLIKDAQPLSGFLSANDMEIYLSGGEKFWDLCYKHEHEFFGKENKVGHMIMRDSKTVQREMFYSSHHMRFRDDILQHRYQDTSLLTIVESLEKGDFPARVYCIGGERRGVIMEASDYKGKIIPELPVVLERFDEEKGFFLYFATPAIFQKGWYREWPETDFQGASMAGAAVKKPLYISGWARSGKGREGAPRHLKRLVPAGSVYFFKADTWDKKRFECFYKKYHFNESLSEEYPDAGFGIAFIGLWKSKEGTCQNTT